MAARRLGSIFVLCVTLQTTLRKDYFPLLRRRYLPEDLAVETNIRILPQPRKRGTSACQGGPRKSRLGLSPACRLGKGYLQLSPPGLVLIGIVATSASKVHSLLFGRFLLTFFK